MVKVGSGISASIVVVRSPVSVEMSVSLPTMADRLSITAEEAVTLGAWIVALSEIRISLPMIVELTAISIAGIDGVSLAGVVDGNTSEIESTSLSSDWEMAVTVEVPSSEGNDELTTVVASKIVLSGLVVNSELMVMSTAVGEGEMTKDEICASSPADGVLSVGDAKGSDENDNVGISKSTLVTVTPTLIPADTISV